MAPIREDPGCSPTPGRPSSFSSTNARRNDRQPNRSPRRFAEDSFELVDEAVILLDAADVVAMAALSDRGYSPAEALQHTLELHAKVRRLLSFAVVEKAVA